jgi:hypothetical protein
MGIEDYHNGYREDPPVLEGALGYRDLYVKD